MQAARNSQASSFVAPVAPVSSSPARPHFAVPTTGGHVASSQPTAETACPICGSSTTQRHRTDVADFEYSVQPSQPFAVSLCRQCRSEFLDPRPRESELPAFYPDDYHAYHDDHGKVARALVKMRAKRRAAAYEKMLGGKTGSLFDVGVGDCRHFDALKEFCSLEFAGVEIKTEIAAKARARGYDVADGTLETMDMTGHIGRYDIVSMNHVLEHVVEPRTMIARSYDLLKSGGRVLGQLPTITCWESRIFGSYWGGYHYPRHLQLISHEGMRRLLTEAGFQDVQVRAAPHLQSAISLQNWLVGHGWNPKKKFGKSPLYGAFLLSVLPFETIAYLCNRGGIMNFSAQRP